MASSGPRFPEPVLKVLPGGRGQSRVSGDGLTTSGPRAPDPTLTAAEREGTWGSVHPNPDTGRTPRGPVTKLDRSARRSPSLRRRSLAPAGEGTPQGAEAGAEASASGRGGSLGHLGPATAALLLWVGEEGRRLWCRPSLLKRELRGEGVGAAGKPGLPRTPRAHTARPLGVTGGSCPGSPPCSPTASGRGRLVGPGRGLLPLEISHEPPTGRGRHAPQLPRGQSERKESRSAPPPPGAAAESLWVAAAAETAQTTLQ